MNYRLFIFTLFFYFLSSAQILREECQSCDEEKPPEITSFRVKVAISSQDQNEEKELSIRAEKIVEKINEEFKNQGINIKFELSEAVGWNIDPKIKTLDCALDDLIDKFKKRDNDLIIGITDREYEDQNRAYGYYCNPGYTVVKENNFMFFYSSNPPVFVENKQWTTVSIMHEIGHFFGLEHSENQNSIMHYKRVTVVRQDLFLKDEIDHINKIAPKVKEEKRGIYKNPP